MASDLPPGVESESGTDAGKLFVGQIPHTYTEDDLQKLFGPYGTILRIHIVRDRATHQPKGCAFVTYDTIETSREAASILHAKQTLPGMQCTMQVQPANDHKSQLSNKSATHEPDGSGKRSGAGEPSAEGNGAKDSSGKQAGETRIYVAGLPPSVDEGSLKMVFEAHGDVLDLRLLKHPDTGLCKGVAFIRMRDEHAQAAIAAINGTTPFPEQLRPLDARVADADKRGAEGAQDMDRRSARGVHAQGGQGSRHGGGYQQYPQGGSGQDRYSSNGYSVGHRDYRPGGFDHGPGPGQGYGQAQDYRQGDRRGDAYQRREVPALPQPPLQPFRAAAPVHGYGSYAHDAHGQRYTPQAPQAYAYAYPSAQPQAQAQAYMSHHQQPQVHAAYAGAAHGLQFPSAAADPYTAYAMAMGMAYPVAAIATAAAMTGAGSGFGYGAAPIAVTRGVAGSLAEGPAGANLFVQHLPEGTTDQHLVDLFGSYGPILSARVAADRSVVGTAASGQSKDYGFVSFTDSTFAKAAIAAMNGATLAGGRRLKVGLKMGMAVSAPITGHGRGGHSSGGGYEGGRGRGRGGAR